MRIIVDTYVLLWSFIEPERLGREATELMIDENVDRFFSAVSSWEIGIKFAKGSLELPSAPVTCIPQALRDANLTPLPVRMAETLRISAMPHHHGDPFDRLLIAQAQHNNMYIMSRDPIFGLYDVDWIEI